MLSSCKVNIIKGVFKSKFNLIPTFSLSYCNCLTINMGCIHIINIIWLTPIKLLGTYKTYYKLHTQVYVVKF